MIVEEKAAKVIADTLPDCKGLPYDAAAALILAALADERIVPSLLTASADLFTRFHAHCRYLGEATGYGYRYWYRQAVDTAVTEGDWPVKIIPTAVTIGSQTVTVDVEVPESTRLANNRQLLIAYSVITQGAAEHGVMLPERKEKKRDDV